MNETTVTMCGNVCSEPRSLVLGDGVMVTSFRLASTPRRYDRASGAWRDEDPLFVTVAAFRGLAANVCASIAKGDPVVVTGRLRLRQWEYEGHPRLAAEIVAQAIGPDLSWGTARFARTSRVQREDEPPSLDPGAEPSGAEPVGLGAEPPAGEEADQIQSAADDLCATA